MHFVDLDSESPTVDRHDAISVICMPEWEERMKTCCDRMNGKQWEKVSFRRQVGRVQSQNVQGMFTKQCQIENIDHIDQKVESVTIVTVCVRHLWLLFCIVWLNND